MLEVEGLRLAWGLTEIIHDVDMQVAPGELLAIFGRNGVGKTTLLQGVAGLGPRRVAGTVRIDGADVTSWSAARLAQNGIVYIPDSGGVFRTLTVEENLRLGAMHAPSDQNGEKSIERAFEIFPALADRRRQHAGSLSGGERRMLGIARGVLQQPRFILFDEPTEGLHPAVFGPIVNALDELRKSGQIGVVWVDRRINLALEIADRYVVIERGRVTAHGPTSSVDPSDVVARMTF